MGDFRLEVGDDHLVDLYPRRDVGIDDGPHRCTVPGCARLRGFRDVEAPDRHVRLQHPEVATCGTGSDS